MLNVILGIFIALIFIGGLNYFLTKTVLKKPLIIIQELIIINQAGTVPVAAISGLFQLKI